MKDLSDNIVSTIGFIEDNLKSISTDGYKYKSNNLKNYILSLNNNFDNLSYYFFRQANNINENEFKSNYLKLSKTSTKINETIKRLKRTVLDDYVDTIHEENGDVSICFSFSEEKLKNVFDKRLNVISYVFNYIKNEYNKLEKNK